MFFVRSVIVSRLHTVIICDDEEDILNLNAAMLSPDYKTVKASSGKEFIQKYLEIKRKVKQNQTIIVLMDYKLLDTTGDILARQIKDVNFVKVILISAFDIDPGFTSRLKKEKIISEFLCKPFKISTLKEIISKSLST